MAIALVVSLGACAPTIETWRSVSGINKNDPDPVNAPFTQNLADAEAGPYPNLASVPPPPTRATTAAERQKLAQSLVADRAATEAAAGPRALSATASRVAASMPTTAPTGSASGAGAPAGAAAPARTASNLLPSGQSGRRPAGEPPAPSPRDSSLEMPDVRALPEPEAARTAPPAPGLAALPRPAAMAEPAPAAAASAMPQPALPVPDLAPATPPPAAGKASARSGPALATVATLAASASTTPSSQDRAEIARVAALYKEKPGGVRVVGFAAGGAGGSDPLANYQAALDRAQAVAKELAAAGIPASKIQAEAAPAAAGRSGGRVEIQFAQ